MFELENRICRTSAIAEITAAKNETGQMACCSGTPACHRVCWPGLPPIQTLHETECMRIIIISQFPYTFLKVSRCHLTKDRES